MSASDGRPLAGIRVLDFSQVMAGPICGAILGALGADVIKVESWARLDSTRRIRLSDPPIALADVGKSARGYELFNQSKRSVSLNLATPDGARLAHLVADRSDLVIDAYRPGVMAKFGLSYAELRSSNPGLIMLSLSGSGQDGPESQYATYAAIFAALGGVTNLTGYRDGIPTEYRGPVDVRVGFMALLACLAALAQRRRTGEGCHIDLAGREVMTTFIGDAVLEVQAAGSEPVREGNEDRVAAPSGCFLTADGETWVALAIEGDDEWARFCSVCGITGLAQDERFADGFRRWKHREAIDEAAGTWLRGQDAHDVVERLQKAGVAATLSYRMDHVLADPHLIARGAIARLETAPNGGLTQARLPWHFAGSDGAAVHVPAPAFGEHNADVFKGLLGLSDAEYERLVEIGAIA